jgi:c(7)-type cytochrome triheme protein
MSIQMRLYRAAHGGHPGAPPVILAPMRLLLPFAALLAFLGSGFAADEKKAPAKLTFEAKTGAVPYDHAAHAKREKNDCKACHEAVFPQTKAPLNFKAGMHKPAEAAKKSCGFCHHAGGKAFSTVGNCANGKCHVKAGAKPASKG